MDLNLLKQLMQYTLSVSFKLPDMRKEKRDSRGIVELLSIGKVVLERVQERGRESVYVADGKGQDVVFLETIQHGCQGMVVLDEEKSLEIQVRMSMIEKRRKFSLTCTHSSM